MYNVSKALQNNKFSVKALADFSGNVYKGATVVFTIPDGNYTVATLCNRINALLVANNMTVNLNMIYLNDQQYFFYYNSLNGNYSGSLYNMFLLDFTAGGKYNGKNSVGWILGFRSPVYTVQYQYFQAPVYGWHPELSYVAGATYQTDGQPLYFPEKLADMNTPKYLYVALDEYTQGTPHSFVCPVNSTFINKNVVAKVVLDNTRYGFGTVCPVSFPRGNLFSDKRVYNGKVDLQRLQIQLLNESGIPVNLNGMDFSLTMAVEHE
jgi:hypothetical protein